MAVGQQRARRLANPRCWQCQVNVRGSLSRIRFGTFSDAAAHARMLRETRSMLVKGG